MTPAFIVGCVTAEILRAEDPVHFEKAENIVASNKSAFPHLIPSCKL